MMPKRYIDSEIWKKEWFQDLIPKWKMFWIYVFTNANHAGIWDVNFRLASFQIGEKVTMDSVPQNILNQIHTLDSTDKWFIPDFIGFQYKRLYPTNPVHQTVIDILSKYDLIGEDSQLMKIEKHPKKKEKKKQPEIPKKNPRTIETINIGVMKEKFPELNILYQLEKWQDWMKANGRTFKDYHASFRNWCRGSDPDKQPEKKESSGIPMMCSVCGAHYSEVPNDKTETAKCKCGGKLKWIE